VFTKVLVANRGEIAVRVFRTLREMAIASVAVYSDADRELPFVGYADEAYRIGAGPATESYLRGETIIRTAQRAGAQAIHPGFGFLAENPDFARACAAAGLTFIGPSPEAMEAMASKTAARRAMAAAGVPIVPGVTEPVESIEEARAAAEEIGYPVAVKAAAGGGGKGIKTAAGPDDLERAFESAQREGKAYFADDAVYLERYLERPRHVEVQVLADLHGNIIHLGERDCSVQRRHQKILEEAPTPALSDAARTDLAERAVKAAIAAGYENVGTLEFLVDANGDFFFIEINCRIQVEHPVTEILTGLDLVTTQIRIAAGEPLGFSQADVTLRGHAIEFRINAEDPEHEFRPGAGIVERYHAPGGPGVRMDSHLYSGYEVPPFYDSLLGKLIVWGPDRATAIARGRVALDELVVDGLVTNVSIHKALLSNETFLEGRMTTNLLDRVGSAAFLAAAARS